MTTTSYWLDAPEGAPRSTVSAGRPDVIVIGGGVTGCACALQLAQTGVRVRLHEARRVGAGASGRNGGFALRGGARSYDTLVAGLGREQARALLSLTERGLDRLAALAGDAFELVGSLRLAADDAELRALQAEYAELERDGFAVAWVDDLGAPLDGLYRAAILHPPDGTIDPGRWLRRLSDAAVAAGAELVEESPIDVGTALRAAGAVVVATDGYTRALLPELAAAIRPTRGQMLATEPLPERRFPRPHYARRGYDYWQQLPDGTLVIGGQRDASFETETTTLDVTTPEIQARLEQLAADLLGAPPAVTHRWSGIWGSTSDELPLVGPVPGRDRVWVAAGYTGHGNVLGLVCGALVADLILGRAAPELALFDPARLG